jgi:hypothetical protein
VATLSDIEVWNDSFEYDVLDGSDWHPLRTNTAKRT